MADRIGSLEPGKQADVVVHDTSGAHWIPRSVDPVLQLVWASDGRSVRDVVVGGRAVVRDGRCTTVDLDALRTDAADAAARLLQRAALDPRSRWPVR
jgi:5-methylthioadenosine/S-adenosylhomocysteine deaminase